MTNNSNETSNQVIKQEDESKASTNWAGGLVSIDKKERIADDRSEQIDAGTASKNTVRTLDAKKLVKDDI